MIKVEVVVKDVHRTIIGVRLIDGKLTEGMVLIDNDNNSWKIETVRPIYEKGSEGIEKYFISLTSLGDKDLPAEGAVLSNVN